MALLSAIGTLSYNGHTFNGSSNVRVVARVVRDRANRTTAYVTFEFTVREVIHAASAESYDAGTQIVALRRQLEAASGVLTFTSRGFGDVTINSGGITDINYGPIIKQCDFQPMGPAATWLLTWVCETSIPDQCSGAAYSGRPVEYSYDLEIHRDEHGFSTRVINGYLVIPANRIANSRQISDTADRYLEQALAGIPELTSFRRQITHRVDESKRVLTFTVTDTELPPNGFQVGCTGWDAEQTAHTALIGGGPFSPSGLHNGLSTIRATYQLSRDRAKAQAFQLFGELVLARVQAGLPYMSRDQHGPLVVPLEYSVTDHITNQEVTCSLTYFVGAGKMEDFLAACGMFTPVPNTNWSAYRASIGNTAGHVRGNAKLFHERTSDAIVSLCEGTTASMTGGGNPPRGDERTIRAGFFPRANNWAHLRDTGKNDFLRHASCLLFP